MLINFIVTGLYKSGGIKIIFEYANRLSKNGHDVCLYFPIKPYQFNEENFYILLKRYYWSIFNYLFKRDKRLENLYPANFTIRQVPFISNYFVRDADITIATTWPTTISVCNLSVNKGKKISFIQGYEIWSSKSENVDFSLKLNLLRITNSNYLKALIFKKFNLDSKVILNGINYKIFNIGEKAIKKIKTITFIDNMLAQKGTEISLTVVKMLNNKYQNLKFICFGFEKFHIIPEYVEFYKNPDDNKIANEIYQQTDIFIYSSIDEGFALPPAEAMACKCAVVTTPVGAVPEYSVHMESAIHVQPGNIDELYNGVCYLLENENELKRISENGYNYVRQMLNWEESVNKFEKFLLQN